MDYPLSGVDGRERLQGEGGAAPDELVVNLLLEGLKRQGGGRGDGYVGGWSLEELEEVL